MKLSLNGLRTYDKIKEVILLIIIGLIMGGISVFLYLSNENAKDLPVVEYEITNIVSDWDSASDSYSKSAIVKFTYQGEVKNAQLNNWDVSMGIGDKGTGYYDAAGSMVYSDTTPIVPIIMAIGSVLLIVGALVSLTKMIKRNKLKKAQDEEFAKENAKGYILEEEGKGELKNYIVMPQEVPGSRHLKMVFANENNEIVYDATVQSASLFGKVYEFYNHVSGKKETHKVGNRVSVQSGGRYGTRETDSYFKFDGKNIYDHIYQLGIRIETEVSASNVFPVYHIKYRGREYGTLKTTGMTAGMRNDISAIKAYAQDLRTMSTFHLSAREEDLDIVFLSVFTIVNAGRMIFD